jgi:hypothetical protein
VHHFHRTARKAKRHRPHGALSSPVHQLINLGNDKLGIVLSLGQHSLQAFRWKHGGNGVQTSQTQRTATPTKHQWFSQQCTPCSTAADTWYCRGLSVVSAEGVTVDIARTACITCHKQTRSPPSEQCSCRFHAKTGNLCRTAANTPLETHLRLVKRGAMHAWQRR